MIGVEAGRLPPSPRRRPMKDMYRPFKTAFPEEACLDTLMDLRFGGRDLDCPACGRRGRFAPVVRRRAFLCEGCGHALYPAVGTPLAALRTPLSDWFFGIALPGKPNAVVRELERQAGLPAAVAERIVRELAGFRPLTEPGKPFAGWLDAIAEAVHARIDPKPTPPAARPVTAIPTVSAPTTTATTTLGPRPTERRSRPLLIALAAGLLGAGISAVALTLVLQNQAATIDDISDSSPTLSVTLPQPTLTLAAVEEDLAAAKAAVEAVTKAAEPPPMAPIETPQPRPSEPPLASTGDPNEVVTFGPIKVRRHLVETVVRASRVVGADPTLLMAVADKESSFSTAVRAKTSSAEGLYQFIEQTWLGTLQEFGEKHGYGKEARTIVRSGNRFTVADPAERERILDLRREPYLAALMAGEMLRRDTLRIEARIGRHLTGGEIYLVHFLGPDGAQTFIAQFGADPDKEAAVLLPKPAEANKSIFYDKDGSLSVAEVKEKFEKMISSRLDRYREVRRLTASAAPARPTR